MNSLHTQLSECRSVLARERDALIAARANVDTLRTDNARLREALDTSREDVRTLLGLLDVHAYDVETNADYQTRTDGIRDRAYQPH